MFDGRPRKLSFEQNIQKFVNYEIYNEAVKNDGHSIRYILIEMKTMDICKIAYDDIIGLARGEYFERHTSQIKI